MAGLVPAIHVFLVPSDRETWMPATSKVTRGRDDFICSPLAERNAGPVVTPGRRIPDYASAQSGLRLLEAGHCAAPSRCQRRHVNWNPAKGGRSRCCTLPSPNSKGVITSRKICVHQSTFTLLPNFLNALWFALLTAATTLLNAGTAFLANSVLIRFAENAAFN